MRIGILATKNTLLFWFHHTLTKVHVLTLDPIPYPDLPVPYIFGTNLPVANISVIPLVPNI